MRRPRPLAQLRDLDFRGVNARVFAPQFWPHRRIERRHHLSQWMRLFCLRRLVLRAERLAGVLRRRSQSRNDQAERRQ